jgi:hypothetical protein
MPPNPSGCCDSSCCGDCSRELTIEVIVDGTSVGVFTGSGIGGEGGCGWGMAGGVVGEGNVQCFPAPGMEGKQLWTWGIGLTDPYDCSVVDPPFVYVDCQSIVDLSLTAACTDSSHVPVHTVELRVTE